MKHLITSALFLLSLQLVACGGDPKKEDVCDCDSQSTTDLCEEAYDDCESDKDCDLKDEESDLNDICKLDADYACGHASPEILDICEATYEACADAGVERGLDCIEDLRDAVHP